MAGRGPLPTGTAIRRNKPTIPTTSLPVSGRTTEVPDPPTTYEFGPAAADWWGWAWRTPQACAWDDGSLFAVARRAQLEDDLRTLEHIDIDLEFLLGEGEENQHESARTLTFLIGKLKGMAGGKLSVAREMRELDDRLGLTPKGLAANRWKIVPDEEAQTGQPGPQAPRQTKQRRALKAVPAAG